MRKLAQLAAVCAFAFFALPACAPRTGEGQGVRSPDQVTVIQDSGQPTARDRAKEAIARFRENDEKNAWTEASCAEVAKALEGASDEAAKATDGKPIAEALYDAALARLRCGDRAEGKRLLTRAIEAQPKDARARTQLVSIELRASEGKAIDQAIDKLEQIVLDAEFQSAEALVMLASLEMRRGSEKKGPGCEGDLDCAKKNVQRALAVDDSFMPAYNQLALYYLEKARVRAGKASVRVRAADKATDKALDQQQLELAALVCSQAIRKNPRYAPIYNTAALVKIEQGDSTGAAAALRSAIEIEPKMIEALMNYAAVNLGFRGFGEAEKAYRAVLEQRPDDYDALIGLALSLRGQIKDVSSEQAIRASQEILDKAKKVDDGRPEAYFNEAILTQEFKVKAAETKEAQIEQLRRASALFEAFAARAGGRPDMADAVKRAAERRRDIEDMTAFLSN